MSSSQYSQGSEEGEIVPKKRGPNLNMPVAHRSGSTALRSSNAPKPRTAPGPMRPPLAKPQQRAPYKTLSEELQDRNNQAGITNNANADGVNDSTTDDEQEIQLQLPPVANMITASQEGRGRAHGSGQAGRHAAQPVDSASRAQTRQNKGKQPAADVIDDPYQQQADRQDRRRNEADSDYEGVSQESPTPSYMIPIDSQEMRDLGAAGPHARHPNVTERPRNENPAAASAGIATDGWGCTGCNQRNVDGNESWVCSDPHARLCDYCNDDATHDRRSDHFSHVHQRWSEQQAELSELDEQQLETSEQVSAAQPPKKTTRGKYGTRHQPYDKLGAGAKKERDDLLNVIRKNWSNPPRLWPEHLTPRRSDGRPLSERDVTKTILAPLADLSELTKNDTIRAHNAVTVAVIQRIAGTDEDRSEKLLPKDVTEAIVICNGQKKRPRVVDSALRGSSAEAGPSFKRPRVTAPLPTAMRLESETLESSETFGRSSPDPSRQLHQEMDDIHVQSTPELAAAPVLPETPPEEQQTVTPPVTLSVTDYAHLRASFRRIRSYPVRTKLRVPATSDYASRSAKVQELFELIALKAESMDKDSFTIEFSVDASAAESE